MSLCQVKGGTDERIVHQSAVLSRRKRACAARRMALTEHVTVTFEVASMTRSPCSIESPSGSMTESPSTSVQPPPFRQSSTLVMGRELLNKVSNDSSRDVLEPKSHKSTACPSQSR
jgi:hypothetical protein